MKEDRSQARQVLNDAMEQIAIKGREHGTTFDSFHMIGQLWNVYLDHARLRRGNEFIQPRDVAQMMIMVKIARSLYGHSRDNFVDAAGYSALAAMLTLDYPKVADDKE